MRLGDVIGHGGLPRLLARLNERGRLPHAIILEGNAGCGRRTLARALAQALLCHAPALGDSCGTCDACRLMVAGNHPDHVELPHDSITSDLPLDLVREQVVGAAFTSPLMGRAKIFIIPGIERLAPAAANSLLKVLEEPPQGTCLIMTTTAASGVLRTILSRAQIYRMAPLSAPDVARIIEGGGIPRAEAHRLSLIAHGSVRGLTDREGDVPLEDLARLLAGPLVPSLVAEVMSRLPKRVAAEAAGERTLAGEQRRILSQWLEALIQRERVSLAGIDGVAACERIERVLRLQSDLERHLSPHVVIEGLALPTR